MQTHTKPGATASGEPTQPASRNLTPLDDGDDPPGWRNAKRVLMVLVQGAPHSELAHIVTPAHARAVLDHYADLVRMAGRDRAAAERWRQERDAVAHTADSLRRQLADVHRKLGMLAEDATVRSDIGAVARILADTKRREAAAKGGGG